MQLPPLCLHLRDLREALIVVYATHFGVHSPTLISRFRTYFINSRGDEAMGTTWSYLDVTALGRQEAWEDSPQGYPHTPPYKWWNWHDNYDTEASPHPKWVEVSGAGEAAFRTRGADDAKPV